ncbi:hypothetical protein K523DRAFT_377205 [Schizophyllum commune Tattone D]|nr:hypothetical protein K523DRAFT_377205 [Schizophyllum commune Tattone D]
MTGRLCWTPWAESHHCRETPSELRASASCLCERGAQRRRNEDPWRTGYNRRTPERERRVRKKNSCVVANLMHVGCVAVGGRRLQVERALGEIRWRTEFGRMVSSYLTLGEASLNFHLFGMHGLSVFIYN